MKRKTRVLVVEDDVAVQTLIRGYLELQDMSVHTADTAANAYIELRRRAFDVVLLDMGLPDEEGLAVARRISVISEAPIIFVTGRDDEESRIIGLEIGAQDYVSKPFHPKELTLRIKNVLGRRCDAGSVFGTAETMEFGPWTVDLARRTVLNGYGENADLTRSELDIVITLVRARGRVLSRDQLLDAISSDADKASDRVIDVLISRIRKKINPKDDEGQLIVTVPGVGYKADAYQQ